jgi:hypothetical protein
MSDIEQLGKSSQWTRMIQTLEMFRNRDSNEDIAIWADEIESAVEAFRNEARLVLDAGGQEISRKHQTEIAKLRDVLSWVRKNYASGPTIEINSRIDAALSNASPSSPDMEEVSHG